MKKYEYILFDADNTLFDFSKAEYISFEKTCETLNICFSDKLYEIYSSINDSLWKKLEKNEITLEEIKVERFRLFLIELGYNENTETLHLAKNMSGIYIDTLGQQTCLIDGAEEICRTLSARYKIYIITNGISKIQRSRFERSDIIKYFTDVFVSEEIGVSKPSPDYFSYVLEKIGDGSREKYLVVGDSLTSDCDGAIASGLDICRFNPNNLSDNGRNITYTVNKLSELNEII